MASQDTYTQYIFKDGQYRLVASSGGSASDVDVEVVTELPAEAPEGTVFYLVEDGSTPSPSGHDKTKRAPVLMPYFRVSWEFFRKRDIFPVDTGE